MTNQTKEKLKTFIYKFVKTHYDELKEMPIDYGFNDKSDMLGNIKHNDSDAAWAFFELMNWGMNTNYKQNYCVGYMEDDTPVYKIDDIYFVYGEPDNSNEYGMFIEVKKTIKTIELFEHF